MITERLLAIDLGVKTGLALFTNDCKLEWYRSQNYGSKNRLARAVNSILYEIPNLSMIVMEGGGTLHKIWEKEAGRISISCMQVQAGDWRRDLLFDREQRNGSMAKQHAIQLAKQVIKHCGANKATSLTDDAAEAILTGFWALKHIGWLGDFPKFIR